MNIRLSFLLLAGLTLLFSMPGTMSESGGPDSFGYTFKDSDENQLSMTWMQEVLATTGNYYEAYDRAFCDGDGTMANCLMDRAGTANAPYWEGGLQYAPPMR